MSGLTETAPIESVVLLDDAGAPLGIADKSTVHTTSTPLHLAFSCHVYDSGGRVLVTRRSLAKLTWPGVWTNSFCGHPSPGESPAEAVVRRSHDELGIGVTEVTLAIADFRYRAVDASGIVENEICPVFIARTTDVVVPNPAEVAEFAWLTPAELRAAVSAAPFAFSPWLGWQLEQWPAPAAQGGAQ